VHLTFDMTVRQQDANAILASSSLGRGVDPAAIADLAHRAAFVEKLRGEPLFEHRQPAETLYAVVRGCLKLLRPLETGRDVIVELIGPGDIIGEAALCDDATYTTRAVCVHPSTALALPRQDVIAFIEREPLAARNVVSLLHSCVTRAQSRVEDMAVFRVRQRIVRFLLRLGEWIGREEGGKLVVPVALSRQEIAELCGTTMETAIRVMSALRQQGLVVSARRGFVLTDVAALETFGAQAA
jgi:CRP-like cAMP-binding protein